VFSRQDKRQQRRSSRDSGCHGLAEDLRRWHVTRYRGICGKQSPHEPSDGAGQGREGITAGLATQSSGVEQKRILKCRGHLFGSLGITRVMCLRSNGWLMSDWLCVSEALTLHCGSQRSSCTKLYICTHIVPRYW
jgi:hypothetical protein